MRKVGDSNIAYKVVSNIPPFCEETWVRPVISPFGQHKLSGGLSSFDQVDVAMLDDAGGYVANRMSCEELLASAGDRNLASAVLDKIVEARPDFAGLKMDNTHLMGILNVTPDSFFDGGRNLNAASAISEGKSMWARGASIIDVGGESTRPGAKPISQNQELARILPVIAGLSDANIRISVDTRHANVMKRATVSGAKIINDVAGLQGDGAMAAALESRVPVVIMHMKGTPENMQVDPNYRFAPIEIYQFLKMRIDKAIESGIPASSLAIDPGFGFGKSVIHNLQLVNWLSLFHGLGVVVLFGASRKSSIAKISAGELAENRLSGSLALAAAAWRQGVHILRVHDVAETAQTLSVEEALLAAEG